MLTEITGLPDHIFGVRATGEVTSDDVKNVLLTGLKRTAERFKEIRYLLVLETDVKILQLVPGYKMLKRV